MIDLAHLGGDTRLPEGLIAKTMAPFRWITFLRRDHPALTCWDLDAWKKWPHIQVEMANAVENPVAEKLRADKVRRKTGALISEFSGVAPLLVSTDMLATFPPLVLAGDLDTFELRAVQPPIDLPLLPVRFFWSARMAGDPGTRLFRNLVIETYADLQDRADTLVDASLNARS